MNFVLLIGKKIKKGKIPERLKYTLLTGDRTSTPNLNTNTFFA